MSVHKITLVHSQWSDYVLVRYGNTKDYLTKCHSCEYEFWIVIVERSLQFSSKDKLIGYISISLFSVINFFGNSASNIYAFSTKN